MKRVFWKSLYSRRLIALLLLFLAYLRSAHLSKFASSGPKVKQQVLSMGNLIRIVGPLALFGG